VSSWRREIGEGVARTVRRIRRVLLVEDEAALRTAIAGALRSRGITVVEAESGREAIERLDPVPDLVFADVYLSGDSAFELFEAAMALSPAPIRIAISGVATAAEGFRLASIGVRRYLQKPVSLAQIWAEIEAAREEPPDLRTLAQESVGHLSLRELQKKVRQVMLEQALGLAKGNHSGAARLLRVSRQAVQQVVRRPHR
jgi:DNA-binding NtrC family response regulator